MSKLETVKVKSDTGFAIINLDDYNPEQHKIADDESQKKVDAAGKTATEAQERVRQAAEEDEARRQVQANRGQVDGNPGALMTGTNTSGTFSEPTPTDIRYPDKTATEFESNMGAQLNRSAAGIREQRGLEQKPGGLHPEVKEQVDEAAAVARAASRTAASKSLGIPESRESNVVDDAGREAEAGGTGEETEIPNDWESLHWRQQKTIAEKITGNADLNAAEARQAIEDEVARRSGSGE